MRVLYSVPITRGKPDHVIVDILMQESHIAGMFKQVNNIMLQRKVIHLCNPISCIIIQQPALRIYEHPNSNSVWFLLGQSFNKTI